MQTRRDLVLSLPALAFLGEALASAQSEPASKPKDESDILAHNHIFDSKTLPIHQSKVGSSQHVVEGKLKTGEGVELHNSTLLPGHEPHPPHQHLHAEFLLIREGNVSWMLDGKYANAGAGDILYAASMQLHGLKNIGTTTAKYFVVAIGPNL